MSLIKEKSPENNFRLNLKKTPHEAFALKEIGVSHHLPWSHLVDKNTFATHAGALGCVIAVRGLAFEVCELSEKERYHAQLSGFFQSVADNVAVYVTHHHYPIDAYPYATYTNEFAENFDKAYQKVFQDETLYCNDLYVTLVVKAPTQQGSKKAIFFKKMAQKIKDDLKDTQKKLTQQLHQLQREASIALYDYDPVVLGEDEVGHSELLSFLSLLVNAEKKLVKYPHPNMNISRYLPKKRISFGQNSLMWQGNHGSDEQLGAVLSIKEYQNHSDTLGFMPLLGVDFSFISTQIFMRLNKNKAVKSMSIQLNHLNDSDDEALSQQDLLAEAKDGVASGYVAFGTHQHTLLILSKTKRSLDAHIATASQVYDDAGLVLVRETLNIESGFFSQMPGNFTHIRRGVSVSSENFADYAPLYNYHTGYINENHLGSAVMLMESKGHTPLYFNFHKRSTKNNPSLGHTLVLAPSDSGKTTLLSALEMQMGKYPHKTYIFDRDRSWEITVLANGGFYSRIKPGTPTGFNPLQLDDTPENRSFLIYWFTTLLVGDAVFPVEHRDAIKKVIDGNFNLAKKDRRLSVVYKFIDIDFPYREALKPWLIIENGEFSYLFDNAKDTLDLNLFSLAGFDLTALISAQGGIIANSVFSYLFHRIKLQLDGKLTGLYMEESWQILEHPYWVAKMSELIPSTRKYNLYLVFITQSLKNILSSPLCAQLLDNTATKIFFPNKEPVEAEYREGFKLTPGQFKFIRETNVASRQFLFKQGNEVAIGRVNLSSLPDYLAIFSSNTRSVNLCEAIRNEVGNDPKVWLPIFLKEVKKND